MQRGDGVAAGVRERGYWKWGHDKHVGGLTTSLPARIAGRFYLFKNVYTCEKVGLSQSVWSSFWKLQPFVSTRFLEIFKAYAQ